MPYWIEIVESAATEAYIANPKDTSHLKPTADLVTSTRGHLRAYYGPKVEDRTRVYGFNVWESKAAEDAFVADTERIAQLREATKSFRAGEKTILHVEVKDEPFAALSAPIVEYATLTLKPGLSMDGLWATANALGPVMTNLPEKWGVVAGVWGALAEEENTLAVLLGWKSVEDHWNTVNTGAENPEMIRLVKELQEQLGDEALVHGELTEWKKE